MSMSTSLIGLVDKDKVFQNHKKVLIACKRAKISLPKETAEYFDVTECPNDYEYAEEYAEEKLSVELEEGKHWKFIEEDHPECGFEVFVRKLPKEITKLRFENSW
jgi:hypothetical protein